MRYEADRARALLASIVESSDDAIYSTGEDGAIVSWNRGAEAMLGYTREEILGQPVGLLSGPPEDGTRPFESALRGKSGHLVDVSLSISPILNAADGVVGSSYIARDIGQRLLAEQKLRESEERSGRFSSTLRTVCRWPDPTGDSSR